MPNVLKIRVENADEVLNASMYGAGAVVQVQSGADGVTFADEGTVAVVSGTRVYTFYDPDGSSTTWYRYRYENAGGSIVSDWTAGFQVGDETAGMICSLYDVEERLGTLGDLAREIILEIIPQVTREIERYCAQDFTGDRQDVTFRVHTRDGRRLYIARGIQSLTTLRYATESQPDTGGTYTTATAGDWYLDPPTYEREPGWPADAVVFRDNVSAHFYTAEHGAELVAKRGWAAVPEDVQRVGIEMVISAHLSKGSGEGGRAVVGPSGQPVILRDPRHKAVLDGYRVPRIG